MGRPISGSFTATGAWITASATHSAETTGSWSCCASWGASPTTRFRAFLTMRSHLRSTIFSRPRTMTGRNPTIAGPVTSRRVDAWMRANIHVEGRPEWRFIKIHTHGASTKEDADEILGPELDRALTYMEKAYNDGAHYVLHYVTAREAFNLARAAVDGKQGDPRQYYDYLIPPYLANRGR